MMYLIVALRNLLQARRRTALLSAALGLVTLFLVMLLALSQGMSDTMIRAATMLVSGHVNVAGFYKAKPADAFPMVSGKSALRKLMEENIPEADYVIDRQRGWGKVVSETGRMNAGLSGIDVKEEYRLVEKFQLAEEREYKEGGKTDKLGDIRQLAEPNTAMIFAGQAKRLEVGVGDVLTVVTESLNGATNTGEVRIVAVAKDIGFMSNWSVFTNKETIRQLYALNDDTTGQIMIYLKNPELAPQVMEKARGVIEKAGYRVMDHQPQPFWMKFETVAGEDWTGQKIDLTTWSDELGALKWTLNAINAVSFGLVGILVVIIIVGIMNAMWIAVRERTQEIGTLRAIGMGRSRVLIMFMTEAILLGFGATGLGALVGWGLAGALNAAHLDIPSTAAKAILMSDTLNLVVTPMSLLQAILVFTVITALAALWPALRAARLQPVTAIHHAG